MGRINIPGKRKRMSRAEMKCRVSQRGARAALAEPQAATGATETLRGGQPAAMERIRRSGSVC